MAEADPKVGTTVNVHEAKTHFSKLLGRVEAGEEIVLSRAGKPVARLVPFAPAAEKQKRRKPGALKHLGPIPESFFEPLFSDEELDEMEGRYSSF